MPDYAKTWPAYEKWKDPLYLEKEAGDEVVYSERAPLNSNEFAYFKKTFKKEYLRYKDFITKMTDPNRSFNYYFAQETLPKAL